MHSIPNTNLRNGIPRNNKLRIAQQVAGIDAPDMPIYT